MIDAIESARAVLAYLTDVVEPSLVDVDVDAPIPPGVQSEIIASLGVAIGKCDDAVKRSEYTSQLRAALSGRRTIRVTSIDALDLQMVALALRGLIAIVGACPNCSCNKGSLQQLAALPARLFGETTSAPHATQAGGLSGSGKSDRPTLWRSSTGASSGSKSKPPAVGSDNPKSHGAKRASPPAGSMSSRARSTTPSQQSNKPDAANSVGDWSWVIDRR